MTERTAGKQTVAKVRDLTTERARRGTLPWSFTIDIGADRFEMKVYRGAGPLDAEAMAQAAEKWGRTLLKMARQLRRGTREGRA